MREREREAFFIPSKVPYKKNSMIEVNDKRTFLNIKANCHPNQITMHVELLHCLFVGIQLGLIVHAHLTLNQC